MAWTSVFIWVIIFFFTHQVSSQTLNFSFNGFKDASPNLTLTGVAEIYDNGAIKLTGVTHHVLGHAFYSLPLRFKDSSGNRALSFSTAFAFAIVPEFASLGGHGLAFVISSSRDLAGSLPSQYLGLLNSSERKPSNQVFAVELDTVKDYEFGDINGNHVGIDINSMKSNFSVPAAYFLVNSTKADLTLDNRQVIQAWIDYYSEKNRLEVRLSPFSQKPSLSILSYDVDLSPILRDEMYVGFSASTGLLASCHYILGWNFNMSGEEASSLSLSSLPSVPGVKKNKDRNVGLIVGLSLSGSILFFSIIGLVGLYVVRKMTDEDEIEDWELDIGPHRFSYRELKEATKDFRDKELIGFGGFGKVYKGTLPNSNTVVAVKRIYNESKQGVREFTSEISSIGRLRHRNLVQLLGWGRKRGDLLLAYDFMPNGSLDRYLFNENPRGILNWDQRFKIIKGVASGLLYLHEGLEQTIIHRDIKAGNVLLDSEMNGRLGDFGLAKSYERGSNPVTTRVVGTLGYLAPELTKLGKPTTSTDVYAFGAVLLEVVCGRRPIEPKALPEELVLVDWVWERWQNGDVLDVVDKRLNGAFDEEEVVMVLKLGLLCSNNSPAVRPTMRQVVRFLERELPLPQAIPAPDSLDVKKGQGSDVGESEDYADSCRLTGEDIETASTVFSFSSGNKGR